MRGSLSETTRDLVEGEEGTPWLLEVIQVLLPRVVDAVRHLACDDATRCEEHATRTYKTVGPAAPRNPTRCGHVLRGKTLQCTYMRRFLPLQ